MKNYPEYLEILSSVGYLEKQIMKSATLTAKMQYLFWLGKLDWMFQKRHFPEHY